MKWNVANIDTQSQKDTIHTRISGIPSIASPPCRDDIEVFVMTQDDYVNWQNGHTVNTLYNSGKVTQETLNVTLPTDAGTYCLVFSNKSSWLTPRAVQANVNLTYYTR